MKKVLSIILSILLLLPNFAHGEALIKEEPQADLRFFTDVLQIINEQYPFNPNTDHLIKGAVKGMLESLDENSSYYSLEETKELEALTSGGIVGIGIVMEYEESYIRVKQVLEGHPAEKAGIKDQDIIVAVDNQPVIEKRMDQVSKLIKGEEGSQVKITVLRGQEYKDFYVKREAIEINPIAYRVLDGNIGHIQINEFSYNMTKHLAKVLEELDKKKVKKLVIDLRNNPGGLLSEAILMGDMFIPQGDLVHIRYKDRIETIRSKLKKPKYEIALLVNGNSASASEIFAGAVKDRKVGKVIGSKTYGKGTVQSLLRVTDGSIIKLTVAEYLTPNKTSIHKKGIEPDIYVENNGQEDLQLKKAVEILSK